MLSYGVSRVSADFAPFMELNIMDINLHKKAVEEFEQRLKGGEKSLRVYGEFIAAEKNFIRNICLIEEKHGVCLKSLRSSRISKILNLFDDGSKIFPHKYRFYDSYVKFCKENNPALVSEIYKKFLSHHRFVENLWCSAISWEQKNGANEAKLKNLFLKALIFLPKSEKLYTTYFSVVLKEISETISADNDNMITSTNMERLFAIFETVKKRCGTFNSFLSLLKKCEEPKYCVFTVTLQKVLIMKLTAGGEWNEDLWDVLAQRELKGFNMCDLEKVIIKIKEEPENLVSAPKVSIDMIINPNIIKGSLELNNIKYGKFWKERPLKRRIELCCVTYSAAIRTLRTHKMMKLYIDAMIELNKDMRELPDIKRSCLITAFKQGHQLKLLSEEHYVHLVKIFFENQSTKYLALEVLPTAIDLYSSVSLYELWISYYMTEDNEIKMIEILRVAMKRLEPSSTVSIWRMIIDYYASLGTKYAKTCQKFFKEACRYMYPAFEIFRHLYLDWCFTYLRMEKTRIQYDTMCKFPLPSLKLHQKMIELELSAPEVNIERVRLCHENIINDFGKDDFQVWIEYIKFEENEANIEKIVEKARNTLNVLLQAEFNSAYLLMSLNI